MSPEISVPKARIQLGWISSRQDPRLWPRGKDPVWEGTPCCHGCQAAHTFLAATLCSPGNSGGKTPCCCYCHTSPWWSWQSSASFCTRSCLLGHEGSSCSELVQPGCSPALYAPQWEQKSWGHMPLPPCCLIPRTPCHQESCSKLWVVI